MENKTKLLEILEEVRSDVDFSAETALIDDGVLDSFDIVTIIGEINEEFDVEITAIELVPENFNSVDAMLQLIQKLQEEN